MIIPNTFPSKYFFFFFNGQRLHEGIINVTFAIISLLAKVNTQLPHLLFRYVQKTKKKQKLLFDLAENINLIVKYEET